MRNTPPPKPGGPQRDAPVAKDRSGDSQKDSVWRRVTGRPGLEAAMRQRQQPYRYESNAAPLRWVIAGLVVWTVAVLALAWSDRQTASTLSRLEEEGIRSVPSTSIAFEDLLAFAKEERIDCSTAEDLQFLRADCGRLLDIRRDFAGTQDRANLMFATLAVVLIATAFAWGTFTHRASRNLLTLKSAEQRYRPDSIVLWVVLGTASFMPFVLFGSAVVAGSVVAILLLVWKVMPAFVEVFKGSDPAPGTGDETAWKEQGSAHPALYLWLIAVGLVLLVNPITVSRLTPRENLSELVTVVNHLVWADLLLILPAVAAIFMLWELHRRQEARHAMVGDIEVTPPRPRNPLEDELDRRIRQREQRRERK